jgi:hypothetical protein
MFKCMATIALGEIIIHVNINYQTRSGEEMKLGVSYVTTTIGC